MASVATPIATDNLTPVDKTPVATDHLTPVNEIPVATNDLTPVDETPVATRKYNTRLSGPAPPFSMSLSC